MSEQRIKLAEEIAKLREQQGMTFKAIGEMYQISPGKVSYLYQDFLRRRRLARVREMYQQENRQLTVSVKMTLGEIVVLRRILAFYQTWVRRESLRRRGENPLFQEPDCVTAEYLSSRFGELEKEKRRRAQENKVLSPKPIDISKMD
ncbi:MAG: hypothetical protein HFF06_09290 [Oscillospiraceae bacterium]|jgi:hypothetical protein|nr:hypothetical protein [Oscillospiraceae bacterium]